jgi:murein L,D-transpeptidase YafK
LRKSYNYKNSQISRRSLLAGLGSTLFLTGACASAYNEEQKYIDQINGGDGPKLHDGSYSGETSKRGFFSQKKKNEDSTAKVTHILVKKDKRKMYLLSGRSVVKRYNIELGFNPVGHKRVQGDGKTPEGTYFINRKNNYSAFHLSLGISYPNSSDRQNARSIGRSPGGDIFLHGNPNGYGEMNGDWTRGCIAVTNDEIEEIWGLIPIRTPITILS